jgi:hypothetical protein
MLGRSESALIKLGLPVKGLDGDGGILLVLEQDVAKPFGTAIGAKSNAGTTDTFISLTV